MNILRVILAVVSLDAHADTVGGPWQWGVGYWGKDALLLSKWEKQTIRRLENRVATVARARAFGSLEHAPVVPLAEARQRSLLAAALDFWKKGQGRQAQATYAQALAIHPELRLADAAWTGTALAERNRFLDAVGGSQNEGVPRCSISLDIPVAHATVEIDGFQMGTRRAFEVVRGKQYTAWIQASGYRGTRRTLDCRSAGQWLETLSLSLARPGDPVGIDELRRVEGALEVSAWILADGRSDKVRVYVYHPEKGLEEMVGDTDRDFFSQLSMGWESRPSGGLNTVQSLNLEQQQPVPDSNHSLWWLLGAAVGIGAAAYLVHQGTAGPAPGWSVQLD